MLRNKEHMRQCKTCDILFSFAFEKAFCWHEAEMNHRQF